MFCPKCGRELNEGEVCTCTASENGAAEHGEVKTSSVLPDSQALVEGAKNAAEAIKNNPMVAEVIDIIKGVMVSPVKQVSENAGRTDILWLILTALETILTSFGITAIFRRGFYSFAKSIDDSIKYKNFSEGMKNIGLSAGKIFGMEFIWAALSIIIGMILVMVLMAICKKNTSFSNAANMTATVFLPSALIMAAAGILSFIYAPLGMIAAVGAVISAVVLGYVGIQKMDKFTESPFWIYVACVLVFTIVSALIEKLCFGKLVEGMIDQFKYFI